MHDQISLSNTQVNNFKSVWLELLKKKIAIIYDISIHKNVDFMELLSEFVPEALDHKTEWEDLYIIKNTHKPKITHKSNHCSNNCSEKDCSNDQQVSSLKKKNVKKLSIGKKVTKTGNTKKKLSIGKKVTKTGNTKKKKLLLKKK